MEHGAGVQRYRKILFLAVGLAIIASAVLGLGKLDPFGFAPATERLSRHFSQMFFVAPFYRTAVKDRKYPAVVVFLFDQKYIDTLPSDQNRHWPLTYAQQHTVFKTLLDAKPKGLFVDLLYQSEHADNDSPDVLTDLFKKNSGSIPIVLPALLRNPYDCDKSFKENETQSKLLIDSAMSAHFRAVSSETVYLGTDNCGNSYPLIIDEAEQWLSPAMSLYKSHRSAMAEGARAPTSTSRPEGSSASDVLAFSPENFTDPLLIQWGSDIERHSLNLLRSQGISCQDVDGGLIYSVKRAWSLVFPGFGESRQLYETCPAITTFHASLLNYKNIGSKELLKELVEDAYVFVGTQVGLHPDISQVPVFGTVPGVYTHAMAFDNLLQYGESYKRVPRWGFLELFFEGLILFAALAVRESLRRWRPFPSLHEPLDGEAIGWVIASFIFPLLVSALIIAPALMFTTFQMNWFGMLLLGFLIAPPRIFDVWDRYETKFLNLLEGNYAKNGKFRKALFFCIQYVAGLRRIVFGRGVSGRNQKVSR